MSYSWLAVLPPLVVIVVTIISRNVLVSLASGIIAAAAIATQFSPSETLLLTMQRIIEETHITSLFVGGSRDHLYTFIFLLLLGILIQMMNHSGGIRAYTDFLLRFIKTPRAAQQTSLMISTTLFVDDYLNNLTVGAIMRPVTDHFKIARVKLAFLLDSVSGPLCMLIPASSWVAFILAQMQASGISLQETGSLITQDPLFVYVACIPYLLYPLLIVFSAWFTVYSGISYGTMAHFEDIARTTGNLYGGKEPVNQTEHLKHQFKGSLWDFILPIVIFMGSFITGILYSGSSTVLGGTATFMQTLQQADPFWALFIASLIAVLCATLLFICHNPGEIRYVMTAAGDGCVFMKNSLLILLLAWTLSTLLKNDLQTGTYLASLLPTDVPLTSIPVLLFILCTVISASTGSVWGTIALMLPIITPLYVSLVSATDSVQRLYPILGALFSGAAAGSHFSPISDAMIMTSFSAGCHHLDHVRTQMSYAANPLIGSVIGFLSLCVIPATYSYGMCVSISLFTAFLVTVALIAVRGSWAAKK